MYLCNGVVRGQGSLETLQATDTNAHMSSLEDIWIT